jgi:hypothetical protein
MRKYERLWKAIKSSSPLPSKVSTPIQNHKRIINAVRKEKCRDATFRYLAGEEGKKYELCVTIEDSDIVFNLLPTDRPIVL